MRKSDSIQTIKNQLYEREAGILGENTFVHSAIVLPLIEKEGEVHLLFEVRAKHLSSQPGEICFPGGKVDVTDASTEAAAVRECVEETGIQANEIDIIAPLDKLITPFRAIVYPYVATIDPESQFSPNRAEVEELFTVPLSFFRSTQPLYHEVHLRVEPEAQFPYHLIPGGENYPWRRSIVPEYFFQYGPYIIWGMTARILIHFMQTTQENLYKEH
ncbi:NUDIX hydrolase [Salsuginibacillus kocurii]|uniref:NUDIX hydrolase n=1 Tax=Salsuginibacillus kocurii TaxID=427078 RepID=UPI000372ED62|nr:CoA pyrophosphatase [Salsuginibacillus kocurii]